jgi:hypothetical protein
MRPDGSSVDLESRGLFLLHTRTHFKKKKKIHRLTELLSLARRGVTYGIRAGSARDLGFPAASVDLNGFLFYIYCC